MTLLKSLNLRNVESPLLTPSASGHKNIVRDEENKNKNKKHLVIDSLRRCRKKTTCCIKCLSHILEQILAAFIIVTVKKASPLTKNLLHE